MNRSEIMPLDPRFESFCRNCKKCEIRSQCEAVHSKYGRFHTLDSYAWDQYRKNANAMLAEHLDK